MKSTACALAWLLFVCGSHSIKFSVDSGGDDVLPHIIHKLAPADEDYWPEAWRVCLKSWKRNYPGWEVRMWNETDIDDLVNNSYPQHYTWWQALPDKISRVDASRTFILHRYGGVYSDMDVYVYKPLQLPRTGQVILLGSHAGRGEMVQNSLMASPAKHEFWESTFLEMKDFFKKNPEPWKKSKWTTGVADYFVEGFGAGMLKRTIQDNKMDKLITILPPEFYMGSDTCTPRTCFTRHVFTGCWAPGSSCAGPPGGDLTEEMKLNDGEEISVLQEMFKQGYK